MGAQPKTERKKDMSGEAERYSHLLAPIRIAGHTYRSRVVSAPRGGIWNEDPECHDADPEQLAEIDLRAGGGQAAFLVGETPVTAAGGRGANEFYGFDDQSEEHTRRYRQFAQRIHDNGALALVELCHVGQAKSEIEGEEQPIGPMDLVNADGVSVRAMTEADVVLSVALCIAVLVLFILFYHKLFAVTFDENFSRATGLKVDRYNTLLSILTALTIVLGMRMMGAMLISSLVIFPALTAMRLFKSFRGVVVCAAVTSVCCFCAGLMASWTLSTPVGASVVAANLALFLLSCAAGWLRRR